MTATLDSALVTANRALARQGRSFHWARTFLSPQHASRATRLYGFCRRLDDLADDGAANPKPQKAFGEIRVALATGQSNDAGICDGIGLFRECFIAPEIPNALLDGLISDLGPVRVQTREDLLRYAYRVAGTVGIMMSAALDVSRPAARPHAIDLGVAMQLTNICRDVAEDARAGRRYLPANMIGDVEPARLISPVVSLHGQIRGTIQELLELADRYYASGEAGLSFLPLRARFGILVAARVYRAIGVRLHRNNFSTWQGRAVVSKADKIRITLQAFFTLPFNRGFWRPVTHQPELHAALSGLPGANPPR
jgi:phytoene synthase